MKPNFMMPKFNLDGGASGGGEPAPAAAPAPTPAATPGQPLISTNPLLDPNWGQAATPPPEPQGTPTIEELDFSGRKVPVIDPVIKDIHKDYSNLNRTFQETNTSLKQMQEQNQMYQQMIQQYQQMQQQTQAPAQPAEPQGPSPEEMQAFSQQYMEKFYDDPVTANKMLMESPFMKDVLNKQVAEAIKPFIEPIQKERKFQTDIQNLEQKYPDFRDHIEPMQQLLQQNPSLGEMGFENVYLMARGQQALQAAPAPSPEQMLNDPNFRQMIMGNEQIKNEMFTQYMQAKQTDGQIAPPMMGNQPGGSAPSIPEQQPKSIAEASKLFTRFLTGSR